MASASCTLSQRRIVAVSCHGVVSCAGGAVVAVGQWDVVLLCLGCGDLARRARSVVQR